MKNEQPRTVPVHPVLAALLAEWRAEGWPQVYGRSPEPLDLISPSPTGRHLADPNVLERMHADLELLGLRPRRVHDARRTFISLALADGARKDVLRWVTHGPEGDIVDLYTTLPWEALCQEVARLRIQPKGLAAATALRQSDAATVEAIESPGLSEPSESPLAGPPNPVATVLLQTHGVKEKAPKFRELGGSFGVPRAG